MKKKIKEIADIQIGYQFREKLNLTSIGTYQIIQAKDTSELFGRHGLDVSNLCRVAPQKIDNKYLVRNEDVIFLSKGRKNHATIIKDLTTDIKTIVAGYFFILRPKTKAVIPEYLTWAINQPPSQNYLKSVSRGSGMPFIPKDAFASLEIHVPPINIQKQIVKLYELSFQESTLLKRLEEKRSKLISGICLQAAR